MKIKAGNNTRQEDLERHYNELQENLDAPVSYEDGEFDDDNDDLDSPATGLEGLAELVSDLPNAPDLSTLEIWQSTHGKIFISTVTGDESEIFLFRPLKRIEHKSIDKSGAGKDQSSYEDAIVRKCLLYPLPSQDFIINSPAGVVPTLYKQIMHHSGYIPEHVAVSLVKHV